MSEQTQRIQEIKARSKAVAEGKWERSDKLVKEITDYQYIALARQDIVYLLELVETLQRAQQEQADPEPLTERINHQMRALMDMHTYKAAQERLSNLMTPNRLREKGITGKRAEGYETGILAAKSLFSELFKPKEE